MDDTLVVDFGALEHAGQSIQSALNTLHSRLDEASQLGKRLTASWQGDAKDAYALRQANWERAGGDLAQMLRDIKVGVERAMQRYQETEARNTHLFPGRG
ncbi:WXG100 family type VII secretion target [Dactylosporangium sp. NPDC049140]|jgi:WXG100 family type VII secretion target|uniref:WXG100 family type VII secretion target n=1 Tax=Dactylosporangium sp. NPDC049140 TaxID=3155647 RepID=UPI0033F5A490